MIKTILSILILSFFIMQSAWALDGYAALDFSGGPIKGFTQVPRGGDFNSTSYQRPTFAEVDLHRNFYYDLEGNLQHKGVLIWFEFDKIKANKRNHLAEPLATHGIFIPNGFEFKACVHFDWYRLGMGHAFRSQDARWTFTPMLFGSFLKYHYNFHAWPLASSRHYTLVSGLFGLVMDYQVQAKTHLKLSGSSTLPLSNLTLYTADFTVEYILIDTPALQFIPRFGIELIEFNYRDEQHIPNHFRYEAKPHVFAGIKLHFV